MVCELYCLGIVVLQSFISVVDGTLNAIQRALPAGQVKYNILYLN